MQDQSVTYIVAWTQVARTESYTLWAPSKYLLSDSVDALKKNNMNASHS